MNNISIVSGVLACAVTRDESNTISVSVSKSDGSPVGQWNFFPNEPAGSSDIAVRRRKGLKLNVDSLFRECSRRGWSYYDCRFLLRCVVQVALLGGELSDLESGMPFYSLVDVLTDMTEE